MSDQERIENALYAVHSRLGAIESKVNLVARAERQGLLDVLKKVVREKPLVGQIYLLLDGDRTQKEICDRLVGLGITTSQPTVSRRMAEMATEYGLAVLIQGGKVKVYGKDRAMEQVLNLTRNIRKWLTESEQIVPEVESRPGKEG